MFVKFGLDSSYLEKIKDWEKIYEIFQSDLGVKIKKREESRREIHISDVR